MTSHMNDVKKRGGLLTHRRHAPTPQFAHLQDAVFVASCAREASSVHYRAYRVT